MLVTDRDTVGLTEPLSEPETEDVALLHCETLRVRLVLAVELKDPDVDSEFETEGVTLGEREDESVALADRDASEEREGERLASDADAGSDAVTLSVTQGVGEASADATGFVEPLGEPEAAGDALPDCETLRERVGELVMLSDGDADHVGSLAADTEAEPLAKAELLRVNAAVVAIGEVDAALDMDGLSVADSE